MTSGFVGFKTDMHATIAAEAQGEQSQTLTSLQAGMTEIDKRWLFPFRGEFFRHFLPVRRIY